MSDEKDWPSFWSALTPSEVAAALRAAPRVALAWYESAYGYTSRDCIASKEPAIEIRFTERGSAHVRKRSAAFGPDPLRCDQRFDSLNDAKQAADAALRAAGWVLLP